ncbi:hypothetical protein [Gryllotalpicola protaetiae]|uniref:Toxin n=1 Tax=Gryllotalpicola protaetiae TaxID=2419771 RepID=A0A387BXB8_9MICO|nr:hypothetical protein [Gryllotalpicola protaetiae]AYG05539.1 hypothetical protein D7I44_17830 [Gryllotalpicola protaetiae]
MRTRWTDSADKHGIDHADTLHAIAHRRAFIAAYDPARVEGKPPADLFVGPTVDGTQMLEVLVHRYIPDAVEIFHVMELRSSTIERARKIIEQRRKEQE